MFLDLFPWLYLSDSYGEDIADTDASDSYGNSDDEDEYESDFIDDDDYEMFPGPPRQKSGGNFDLPFFFFDSWIIWCYSHLQKHHPPNHPLKHAKVVHGFVTSGQLHLYYLSNNWMSNF